MSAAKRRVTRLFVDRELDGDALALDGPEAHYVAHVLRLKRGDELVAFNGAGAERYARLETLQRRGASLSLLGSREPLAESALAITLLQALPKADAMDSIVQKATELGVRALVPAYADFSVVKLDDERTARRIEHWRRIARSACEQCGRHRPPEISEPLALERALDALPSGGTRLVFDVGARRGLAALQPPEHGVVVAIGPEGGFAADDRRRFDAAGFRRVGLGARVLRAETAALAACAIVQSLWGDLGA
jgi:16S rRNA (uracil1498-N3)-methyltransferase